ncbi:MAG TPA: hypothetical protein DD670_17230 [Planctomycetaceae bacterium]|nr:hypothetical protein [Planctomycetaceae bacterium]
MCFLVLLSASSGCNRAFYRQQADREVYCLQTQGAAAVGDAQACYPIQPGIESRMFDPNSPDCPPMPPDDPVSHKLMQCVDGKRGWRGWDRYGSTRYVENPQWDAYLPRDAQGNVVLDRTAAMQLALCNSREYQQQLENLYLSALEVTFQRFRFDAQFFGGNRTFFEARGREIPGGSSSSILGTDTSLQMQKLFATGGELVVGVANSLVWQFAGPDEYSGITLLDFSLFQPLLRAGGRAVVLEGLTDAERALVANIRQMERFQRGFYTQIVAGRNPGSGPSPGPITLANLSPGGGGAVGGLMALLRQQVLITNQRANVVALRDSFEQLKAFFNAERVDWFQVEQARLQHYQAQIRLLDLQNQYQNAMDSYKILLGLPPGLDTKVADPLLAPFDLISADLTETQNRVTTILADLRDPQPGAVLSADVQSLGSIIAECRRQIRNVAEDMKRLDESLPARRENLLLLARRPEFKTGDADPSIVDVRNLDDRVVTLERDYDELCQKMELNFTELDAMASRASAAPEAGKNDAELREQLKTGVGLLAGQLVELSLCQARTRLDSITLKPLDLDPRAALEIARTNRRDWKNARAALVDQWRQIEVVANELESDLNVTFSGDLRTVNDSPVQFQGTRGRLRVGLEFDAPLTRLVERNRYRRALIAYQQARREYYAYEDEVYQALRRTLRAIQLAQINFEQRRAAVHIAATQVYLKQYDLLHRPPAVGGRGLGDTAARDVVDSINNLLNEQNSFLEVWVDYEVQRLNLAFDLGVMRLDNRGMWLDDASFEDYLRQLVPEVPELPEEIDPGIIEQNFPPLDAPNAPNALDGPNAPTPDAPTSNAPTADASPIRVLPPAADAERIVPRAFGVESATAANHKRHAPIAGDDRTATEPDATATPPWIAQAAPDATDRVRIPPPNPTPIE